MATDPQSLLNSANCYNCNTPGEWQLIRLALLRLIVLGNNPMAAVDPQILLSQANCYNCYLAQYALLELALLSQIASGSGGTGTCIAGGLGGDIIDVFKMVSGHGGNATANNGVGGNAGNINLMFNIISGNGGNDAFGNIGGNGGNVSGSSFHSGNGGDATAGGQGGNGGNTGQLLADGGNAVGVNNGGNGGTITFTGNGTNTSGNISVSATSGRNGGSLFTFGSSYAPMTIFTTTTTAGPNATTSATSLIGTVAFLAPPPGQNSGAVIASNQVDHAGRTLRFKLSGYIATNGTPTLDLKLSLGGTSIIDTGAQTLPTGVTSTQTWTFSGEATFRTTGSSGTCIGQGEFYYHPTATTIAGFSTANTTTTTIDTTKDESITCTAQFSTGIGCTLQCTTAIFELVN